MAFRLFYQGGITGFRTREGAGVGSHLAYAENSTALLKNMQASSSDGIYPVPEPADMLLTLSQARLAPYRHFFACRDDMQLLGAYLWGQALAGRCSHV